MIRKSRRRRREKVPLEVQLSLAMRFGEDPQDVVTVMENRRVPMVGSVFAYRDRILRAGTYLLVRAGLAQPRVARELFPLLKLLRRKPRA